MTVFVDFQPTETGPFQFNLTLEGNPYVAVVPWNVFAQRWYFELYQSNGTLVVSEALVGSRSWLQVSLTTPPDVQELCVIGVLHSFIAQIDGPSGVGVGQRVHSVLVPEGTIVDLVTGKSVSLALPLGVATTAVSSGVDPFAQFDADINLIAPYFETASLVFREMAGRFEVNG